MDNLAKRAMAAAHEQQRLKDEAARERRKQARDSLAAEADAQAQYLQSQAAIARPALRGWFDEMEVDPNTVDIQPVEALKSRQVVDVMGSKGPVSSKMVPPTTVFTWTIDNMLFEGFVDHPIDQEPILQNVYLRVNDVDGNILKRFPVPTQAALGDALIKRRSVRTSRPGRRTNN